MKNVFTAPQTRAYMPPPPCEPQPANISRANLKKKEQHIQVKKEKVKYPISEIWWALS